MSDDNPQVLIHDYHKMNDETSYVGAAAVSLTEMIWGLKPGTSAQRAEMIDLTQALRCGKGKFTTIYMDSCYAFTSRHVQGVIYRRRELLATGKKDIRKYYPS